MKAIIFNPNENMLSTIQSIQGLLLLAERCEDHPESQKMIKLITILIARLENELSPKTNLNYNNHFSKSINNGAKQL